MSHSFSTNRLNTTSHTLMMASSNDIQWKLLENVIHNENEYSFNEVTSISFKDEMINLDECDDDVPFSGNFSKKDVNDILTPKSTKQSFSSLLEKEEKRRKFYRHLTSVSHDAIIDLNHSNNASSAEISFQVISLNSNI